MSLNDHAAQVRQMTMVEQSVPYTDAILARDEALERVEMLERERNQLYGAMREVCRIAGGQTTDGVSVAFLMQVPAEVAAALAEARKPCPCRQRDARIDAAREGTDA
jgi:hypothetical protein